jgi:hypothetical protein
LVFSIAPFILVFSLLFLLFLLLLRLLLISFVFVLLVCPPLQIRCLPAMALPDAQQDKSSERRAMTGGTREIISYPLHTRALGQTAGPFDLLHWCFPCSFAPAALPVHRGKDEFQNSWIIMARLRVSRGQALDALLRREQELRLSAAAQQAVSSPYVDSVTVTTPCSCSTSYPTEPP